MRTTITFARDVAIAVEELRRQRGLGISEVVNDLVRQGLSTRSERAPFRQKSFDMGLPLYPLEDISGLLDILEGVERRT